MDNIKAFIGGLIIFGAGAITGYAICSARNKSKFDKELKKAAEALERTHAKLNEEPKVTDAGEKPDDEIRNEASEIIAAASDSSKPDIIFEEDGSAARSNAYTDPKTILEEQDEEDADEGFDAYDYALMMYRGTEDILLISKEEYDDNDLGYELRDYIFFENEMSGEMHMIDSDGNDIEGWESETGYNDGNFDEEMFKKYDGTIYIRNDIVGALFSIRKSTSEYIK